MTWMIGLAGWLVGCVGAEGSENGVMGASVTAVTANTEFERSLVEPLLVGIRAGVEPWNDRGIGLCRGERTCEEFLGSTPGELKPGEYLIRADLRVPLAGPPGTWTVRFETECVPKDGEPVLYNRSYEVVAPEGGERPFRLSVLRRITSPNEAGPETCSFTLTAPHPDGDNVFQGSWSTP